MKHDNQSNNCLRGFPDYQYLNEIFLKLFSVRMRNDMFMCSDMITMLLINRRNLLSFMLSKDAYLVLAINLNRDSIFLDEFYHVASSFSRHEFPFVSQPYILRSVSCLLLINCTANLTGIDDLSNLCNYTLRSGLMLTLDS